MFHGYTTIDHCLWAYRSDWLPHLPRRPISPVPARGFSAIGPRRLRMRMRRPPPPAISQSHGAGLACGGSCIDSLSAADNGYVIGNIRTFQNAIDRQYRIRHRSKARQATFETPRRHYPCSSHRLASDPCQPSAGYRISRGQSAGRLRRAALEPDKLGEWRIWPTTAARQLLDQARNRSVWMTVYLV